MPTTPTSADSHSSAPFDSLAPPDDLLRDLLAVSLTGVIFYTPLFNAAGEVTDFTFTYLNPAAQRMLRMPERPTVTHKQQWPQSEAHGTFAFHIDAFLSGEPREYNINYQADGHDNYYRLAAQRSGQGLLVSFTDTADQPRTPVESALRESQAREQEARVQAEHQRNEFWDFMAQAPMAVAVYRGPQHRVEMANAATLAIWDRPLADVLHRPVFEILPEAADPTVVAIFDRVFSTGTPYTAHELPTPINRHGQVEVVYWNFVFEPERQPDGRIIGILSIGTDVTEQVRARLQVEQLNRELEARVQERTLQVREQGQRLERLFMQAPAAICILGGPELVFELVNPIYQQLFPERELLGKPLREALPELVDHATYITMRQVFETGETSWQQALHTPLARIDDGVLEDRYFNYVLQPRYNEQGHIDGVLVFGFDVTEQVQARRSSEESREELKRFKFMADQARDPFILMRADGTFAYLNQRALEAWGYTAEEMRNLRVPDIDPIYQEEAFSQLFARVQQQEHIPLFETQHRRKDGHVYPVEISAVGLQLENQPHLLVVARDVTEQKHILSALQESEARFRIMADAAPNMVWAVHPDSSIRYVNRAFLDFVGLENEQQYIRTGWRPYLHPDELELTQHTLSEAIGQGRAYILEHRMRHHDGQYRWLLAQGAPSFLANGELFGYVGSAIDITDLKQANEQLRRTNVDLDNFIYAASHDLKAPISNIEGLLQLLRADLPPEVAQGADVEPTLALMGESVERFKRTIEHLTEVSKLQKEHAPATTAVDLAVIVEDVRQDLAPLIQASGARLRVEVTDFPPVLFPEKNLRSVVYNLLSNALKYRSPDCTPHIDVRAHVRTGFTVLEVHDNGLGIAATHLPKLFTMFQRFHDHVEGSGIGLYMVKKMVENADGRVEVHSQAGAGTTFFVHLPHAAMPLGT
ncbi:PAS domain-containing protein [Hymenobacter sp. BT188]|uniref:PAS domain-containing sensor histidine kinase n=1 Tax=Hymenobacter sp. BT188 TaxID=2763504 RepID=UPI001650EF5D|nr:PAS domain S-box protein [Hymenobacter sp. BT188]MBC6606259.1 PAS domain-containing protein [Hymenobacter sp. BT188]